MKKISLIAGLLMMFFVGLGKANAQVSVNINAYPAPVYFAPQPVYVNPYPAPVYVAPVPRVYVTPAPVYVRPYYYQNGWRGGYGYGYGGWGGHRGYGHGYGHGHCR